MNQLHPLSIGKQDQPERADFQTESIGMRDKRFFDTKLFTVYCLRSSSLHDLARARLEPTASEQDGGVRWSDEQTKLPNIGMPGLGTQVELSTNHSEVLQCPEKAPTSTFTIRNLLRQYPKLVSKHGK